MLAAFDQSDLVALLATLDIPALKNLKLTLETLDLLNYPRERWRLVLNRADSKVGLALSEVEKTLKAPIAAQIPSSRDVPASINRGVPIVLDDPKHPVSHGHQGASPSAHVAATLGSADGATSRPGCAPTGAACCAGGRRRHEPRRPVGRGQARPRRRPAGARRRRRSTPPRRAPRRSVDPFADLKRTVHQTLLDNLGPKLYDSRLTQSELEQKVRQTLQEVLAQDETPLTVADRARIAQEIADDILGYGPLEPYLRDPDITEVMVNGLDSIYVERAGRIHPVDGDVHRRGAPAPHDRQDRGAGRAAGSTSPARWSTPACPTAAASTRSSRRSPSTARC